MTTTLDSVERPSTAGAYRGALRHYLGFCYARGLPASSALPASASLVCAYLYHCQRDLGLSVRTVENRASALQFWHRRLAHHCSLAEAPAPPPSPCDAPAVRRLLRGMRLRFSRPPKGRLPISVAEFRAIYHHGFDTTRPSGLHNRLALFLLNLGCLRRSAAASLRVCYRVVGRDVLFLPTSDVAVFRDPDLDDYYIRLAIRVDKNVTSADEVYAYIPASVPALGLRPVALLLDYLRLLRPPSGGYLLAAPRGTAFPPSAFSSSPYGGFTRAFQVAYRRAVPSALRSADVDRVGSHSGRKSLAQWLWDSYGSLRLIADVGHWRCRQDAANLYFFSSRSTILRCLRHLRA